ncbi:MAG: sigma-70 family RNA polymerase sigma factor [Deltaproteobacteria bacterium]|nr:sigma-70 family RNA polymerase sigma factor [Deltaproteobacteria bacterium]
MTRALTRDAFSREAMGYLDHLYRVAVHLVKEPHEAEDLVQETYARALGSYDQFAPGSNLKAWLTRILYNFFFDNYHQKKRWVSVDDSSTEKDESDYWERVPAENPGPENRLLLKELRTQISDALRKIPEEFRLPITLVDMGDFSYAEAAEILSCPVGTVRSRLSRGRRLLFNQLKEYVATEEKKQAKQ